MRKFILVLLTAIGLVFVLVCGLSILFRHNETVSIGREIRIDDSSVLVRSMGRKGDKVSLALTVFNHAKRVDFDFKRDLVKLIDDSGTIRTATSGLEGTLQAGGALQTTLSFDLPLSAKPAFLKWNFGGGVGSYLDDLLFGDKRIALN